METKERMQQKFLIDDEEHYGRELLRLWDEGRGDHESTQAYAWTLYGPLRFDQNMRRLHLETVKHIAAGPVNLPGVHMLLFQLAMDGAVDLDPASALHHLQMAIDAGDGNAQLQLGSYLLQDNSKLTPVLPQDTERGMDILLALGKSDADINLARSARKEAASYLLNNSSFMHMSDDERELVDMYATERTRIKMMDYVPLARYFEEKVGTTDYSGPAYREVRELLKSGAESQFQDVRDQCIAVLKDWGLGPQASQQPAPQAPPQPEPQKQIQKRSQPLPVSPPETTQDLAKRAGEAFKIGGMLAGTGLIIAFWWVIGGVLLAIVAAISAVTLPLILLGAVVALVLWAVRR